MWIFTPWAFLSVVAHRDKPNVCLVRARAKQDLVDFKKKYCRRLGKIWFNGKADYPWRSECGKKALANAMRRVVGDIDYTNFKNEVTRESGHWRHDAYMDVWSDMRRAQSNGKLDGSYERSFDQATANRANVSRIVSGPTYPNHQTSFEFGREAPPSRLFPDVEFEDDSQWWDEHDQFVAAQLERREREELPEGTDDIVEPDPDDGFDVYSGKLDDIFDKYGSKGGKKRSKP